MCHLVENQKYVINRFIIQGQISKNFSTIKNFFDTFFENLQIYFYVCFLFKERNYDTDD